MSGKLRVALCAALLICAPITGVARAEEPTPLAVYAALPVIQSVTLAPNGEMLAYIRRSGEDAQVIVQSAVGETLLIADADGRRARGVFWASPEHIGVRQGVIGRPEGVYTTSEFQIVDLINVRTRSTTRAMRMADRDALGVVMGFTRGVYRGEPVLYVEGYTREPTRYRVDLYRVDLETGRGRLHASGGDWTNDFILKRDGEVAARVDYDPRNGAWALMGRQGSGWKTLAETTALLDRPSVGGFGRSHDSLIMYTEEEERYAIKEVSLADGSLSEPMDLEHPVQSLLYGADGRLKGVGFIDVFHEYQFFDDKLAAATQLIKNGLPGREISLVSMDDAEAKFVFYSEGGGDSGTYYLYDSAARRLSLIGRAYPMLLGEKTADVRIISYKAADGLEIPGYLTLPRGRDPSNLPLVVLPHGGPASRDYAGFDWWAQALASRGYAVLQPNFRGSDGLGPAFLEAGYGEWGRKMQSDLSDGVRHLAGRGLIDPQRVCIVGASYGGYAALAGMTLDTGIYKCAVAVAPVSDLRSMLASEERFTSKGSRNSAIRYWNRFMGGEGAGDRTLDERSPARLAERVQGPVLLIHGRDDTVVPYDQSTRMQSALQAAGKDSRLVTLEGEDHYLSFAGTRQQMLTETVAFLERHNPAQ